MDVRSTWHGRLFVWTHESWAKLTLMGRSDGDRGGIRTNTCHYVRTLLIKFPILLALNVGWAIFILWCGASLFGCVLGAVTLAGVEGFALVVAGVVAFICVVGGMAWLVVRFIGFVMDLLGGVVRRWEDRRLREEVKRERGRGGGSKSSEGSSIFAVLKKAAADAHARVCTPFVVEGRK